MKLIDIEGLGPIAAQRLRQAVEVKLRSRGMRAAGPGGPGDPPPSQLQRLLLAAAAPQDRKELAASTGIPESTILQWVNLADLDRIKGIGSEYCDLLEEAGVDTAVELAQRSPENLLAKMREINKQKNLVNRMPGIQQVRAWVAQAKKLPRVVTY